MSAPARCGSVLRQRRPADCWIRRGSPWSEGRRAVRDVCGRGAQPLQRDLTAWMAARQIGAVGCDKQVAGVSVAEDLPALDRLPDLVPPGQGSLKGRNPFQLPLGHGCRSVEAGQWHIRASPGTLPCQGQPVIDLEELEEWQEDPRQVRILYDRRRIHCVSTPKGPDQAAARVVDKVDGISRNDGCYRAFVSTAPQLELLAQRAKLPLLLCGPRPLERQHSNASARAFLACARPHP